MIEDLPFPQWLAAFRARYGPVGSQAELRELWLDGMTVDQANADLLQEAR